MKYRLLRSVLLLWLLWGGVIAGGVMAAKLLPPEPAGIFFASAAGEGRSGWRLTWVDVRTRTAHHRDYPYVWVPAAGLSANRRCQMHFSLPELDAEGRIRHVSLVILDLRDGRFTRYALPEYSNVTGNRAWSPDNRFLWLRYQNSQNLKSIRSGVLVLATGEFWQPGIPAQPSGGMLWSPDSRQGVAYELPRLTAYENQSGYLVNIAARTTIPLPPGNVYYWRWSPDSRFVTGLDAEQDVLYVMDTTGEVLYRLNDFNDIMDVQWYPDSQRLMVLARRTGPPPDMSPVRGYIWSPAAGTLEATRLRVPSMTARQNGMWVWSPDLSQLYYTRDSYNAVIVDVQSGETRFTLENMGWYITRATWSPDGRYLFQHRRFQELLMADTLTGHVSRLAINQDSFRWYFAAQEAEFGYYNWRLPGLETIRFSASGMEVENQLPVTNSEFGVWCYPEEIA